MGIDSIVSLDDSGDDVIEPERELSILDLHRAARGEYQKKIDEDVTGPVVRDIDVPPARNESETDSFGAMPPYV